MLGDVPDLEAFYGSQWMILSRAFARHVVDELDAPGTVAQKLREWFVNGTVVVEGVGRVKPVSYTHLTLPTILLV